MKIFNIKYLIVFVLFVVTISFATSTLAQTVNNGETQKQVLVETLSLPNQPISFDFATVTNIDGKDVLTFSSLNKSNVETTKIEIVAFTVDSKGNITGGQGFVQGTKLLPNAKQTESVILKNKITDGDKMVLAISGVNALTNRLFNVEAFELIQLVRLHIKGSLNSYFKGQNSTITKVRYTVAAQETYCSRAL